MIIKCDALPVKYEKEVATLIHNAAFNAYYKKVLPSFKRDNNGDEFYSKNKLCIFLLEKAIEYADEDYEGKAVCYDHLANLYSDSVNNCYCLIKDASSAMNASALASSMRAKGYKCEVVGNRVTVLVGDQNEKEQRKKKIEECSQKAEEYKNLAEKKMADEADKAKAEQRSRNDACWKEHAEEKQKLDSESAELSSRLDQIKKQLSPYDDEILKWEKKRKEETPAQSEKRTVETQIAELRKEMSGLGIFKGKEKKALQDQIINLNSRISKINDSIEEEEKEQIKFCNDKIREIEERAKPVKDDIVKIQRRLDEIDAELTKDR